MTGSESGERGNSLRILIDIILLLPTNCENAYCL